MTSPARQLLIDGTDAPATTGGGYLDAVILTPSVSNAWRRIVRHWVPRGSMVVDLTHRTGIAWNEVPRDEYRVIRLDRDVEVLSHLDVVADYRAVPLKSGVADCVFVDPPWLPNMGKAQSGYAGRKYTSAPVQHRRRGYLGIIRPRDAREWARIAKPGAWLIVRCQAFHNGGAYVNLPWYVTARVRPLWKPWDAVMHVAGGMHPQREMKLPPKTAVKPVWFLVFRRAKTKSRVL